MNTGIAAATGSGAHGDRDAACCRCGPARVPRRAHAAARGRGAVVAHDGDARPVSDTGRPAMAVRGAVTEARGAAADVLTDLRSGELLDSAFERRTMRLDPRDRRWTRELVYGMLRRRSWLDALLDERVRGGLAQLDPDLIDLLRLGAYQLLSMGSVPAYAAIAQTVELAKRRHGIGASKLANAVLRRLDRERERLAVATPEDPVDALALRALASALARGALDRALGRGRDARAPRGEQPRGAARRASVSRRARAARGDARGRGRAPSATRRSSRDSLVLTGGVGAMTELGAFKQGLFHLQDPASTLVTRYAAIPAGARGRRPVRGAGRQDARARAHRERRVRRRSRRSRGCSACARTCAGSTRRNIVPVRRRRALPAPCRDGRRADRRAVHRHGHVPPASRRALAAQGRATSPCCPRCSASILRAAATRRASGRAADLQHLLARARGERRADRELPRRASGVAARAAAGGRGAGGGARRRTAARAPAAPRHRRRVRGAAAPAESAAA